MAKDEDPLTFGVALFASLVIPVIAIVSLFTVGWPLALIGKFAWNEMIATWLPLPTATAWNMFGLMVVASLFIPTPSKVEGWLSVLVPVVSKPLFILGATIIIS